MVESINDKTSTSLAADFGLSKIIDDQVTMKTVCGTPGYCGEFDLDGLQE